MLSRTSSGIHNRSLHDLRDYFRTLSDGARLNILDHLASSPDDLKVSDLARAVRLSQPLCSWHLRRLVRIGLVKMRRVGREARCSLDRARLGEYQHTFSKLLDEHYARAARRAGIGRK
jgi:DNA-binding transcriptional ArsR family regulator